MLAGTLAAVVMRGKQAGQSDLLAGAGLAMILAAIAVPTVQMIFEQMDEPDGEFLTVEVIGHRWWFEYYYPDYDIYTANEMAIPVGVPVRLEMTSTDLARSPDLGVIHSFWIPRLAGKQDLVPTLLQKYLCTAANGVAVIDDQHLEP